MNTTNNTAEERTVFIVEDDQSLREAICITLKVRDIAYREFESAAEILATLSNESITSATCVLLDLRLGSGPSGLSVFDKINALGLTKQAPVIFMTGHGDLETAVDVMRLGAFDFVTKPFSTPNLIKKIESALHESEVFCAKKVKKQRMMELIEQLTGKEKEVMHLLIAGKTNREIAERCKNSTRTVELHRARVFQKLKVSNAVELTHILSTLES
jgi:two-component system, LuxR family, response regulator DctR